MTRIGRDGGWVGRALIAVRECDIATSASEGVAPALKTHLFANLLLQTFALGSAAAISWPPLTTVVVHATGDQIEVMVSTPHEPSAAADDVHPY
jgi:hypothetical protein